MIKRSPLVLSVATVERIFERVTRKKPQNYFSPFLSRTHFHHFLMVNNLEVNSTQEYVVICVAQCPPFYSNHLPQLMGLKQVAGLSLSLMVLALTSVHE